jgi:2-polyprenyl-6-methoxyphenol hydroxylase-like FAD-dependent oxidoreductase
VVTSFDSQVSKNFGLDEHLDYATRYGRALEFVEVARGLWDSYEDDAFPADVERGVFLDRSKLHALNHVGEHFKVAGPLNLARSKQGQPVIFQSGVSEDGRNLAAHIAEGIFAPGGRSSPRRRALRGRQARAAALGRNPDHIVIFIPNGASPVVAETDEAPRPVREIYEEDNDFDRKLGFLGRAFGAYDFSQHDLDAPFPDLAHLTERGGRTGGLDLVSRPARTAGRCARSSRRSPSTSPSRSPARPTPWPTRSSAGSRPAPRRHQPGLPGPRGAGELHRHVVPILQQRGLYRTEYEGDTLRGNLGLPFPVNRYTTFPPEWVHGIKLITSLTGHELVPNRRRSFTDRGTVDRGTGGRADQHSLADRIRRPQTALQQVFLNHLGRHGVPVTGGWQLDALHEDADWIDAEVTGVDSGERRTIRARYVLGADGGSSTVRRLTGIGRDGERAPLKRLRLIVRTGDESERLGPAPSGVNLVFNAKAWSFLAAVSTREWRVYAGPYPLDYEPTNEELIEIGRAAFGFDLDLEVASATTYYDSSRVAQRFRKGRVLLAGDAAHVRTPGGNLGEGFGDVANLGWKLAAVLSGRAPDALLDSYDAERRRHNWRIADYALERARRGYELREQIRRDGIPDDADLSAAAQQRRAEIGALIGRRRLESAGVEFDERYDASAAIWYEPGQLEEEKPWQSDHYEDDPRPGHRAPDGYLDPWGDTLYDRIGNDFALLVLTEDAATGQAFAAEAAARSLPLSVIHLPDPAARELYGADNVLIRPDQHVAWRGARVPDGGAAAVLDLVLGGAREGARGPAESELAAASTGVG